MNFLRKFNISKRLMTMSMVLIVFTIIMGAIGSFNIANISDRTNTAFNKEVKSLTYLQSIKDSFLHVGTSLRDITLGMGNSLQSKEELEAKIYTIQEYYMDMADDVINFTNNLNNYEDTEEDIATIIKIENLIENDYRIVVNSVIQGVREGTDTETLAKILADETTTASLEMLINDMYQKNLMQIQIEQTNSTETVTFTRIMMVLFNIIILIVSILMGNLINNSISKPIQTLLGIASKISHGDFDVQMESVYKDEVGNLARSFSQLIHIIHDLTVEMEQMAIRQADGDIDAVIDVSKFSGAYQEVAVSTNKMMTDLVNDVLSVTACLTEFGHGNFKADIPKFLNKKAVINHGIDELRTNLTVVSDEINSLVNFAASGELKKRADYSKYSGDWATIIVGLNNLLEAVVAPINEASFALQRFSQGNLNTHMEGDYKGDFAIIKQSYNMTVDSISSYIVEIDQVLGRLVNEKDFNVGIEREYIGDFVTIKESINKIIDTFHSVIAQMNRSSFEVSEGAREITSSNLVLSNGYVTQSGMVDQLNKEIEVLKKQTIQNAENAQQANSSADAAKDSATAATAEMEKMLDAMHEINAASNDISKIIKVINDITFQTNLLALNASVEAARAGVHGKGFSVVAEEVRNLAGKSKEAADQTTAIIERTIQKVNDGSKMANKTAQALGQIVNQTNDISILISEIDSLSGIQSGSITRINKDIGNILQVTEDAKRSSAANLSYSERLSQQSNALKTIVEEFNLRV